MNLESEKKLSMDELMALNRPAPTAKLAVQKPTPPPEAHPTKEEWAEMMECICTLGYYTERQTGYLKKVSELLAQLPTRTQTDELLKAVQHLEQMAEQAGKPKEKRFSLPSISLPSLYLPRLSPALLLIPVMLVVLWAMWYSLDALWSAFSLLTR